MSNTFLKGNEIILQPREGGDNVQVNSLGDKEQRVNSELVTTHREASFDIHKPTNIEGNTHITGNLTVTGGLTSATPAIDNNRLVMNTDANSIADSTLLPIKDPTSAPMAGWYINNAGGDKANYYFYGKTNLPEVHTLDELKYLYALVDIRAGGNLYLNVYTQRQNDGNDAGAWYRSRLNYIIGGSGSTGTTGLSLLYVNKGEQPSDIFDSVQRVECLLDPFSSNGLQAGTEQILTISIQSDSGAPAGTIEYVIQNVGFKLEHVIQNFMLITDNYSSEADIRAIVESYGYQDEPMVNALISSALADYETTAEIDARGYQTEAQVNALISTAIVDFETTAEIDARGYLTEPEIQTLIDASAYVPNNRFFEMILTNDVSVNGQDNAWYLNNANGMTVTEGGANWDGSVYTMPEDGNYQINMAVTAQAFADEFKCYLDVLNGSTVEKKYILDWSKDAYGRHSTMVVPTSVAGRKLRFGVYNPNAIGQQILGLGVPTDRVYIDFESFAVAPISNSAGMSIQGGWSGGAQPYFQNDTTDDETIVNTLSVAPDSQSWFTGNVQLYNNPGQGSPHTPKLLIESGAASEAAFNTALRGKTYKAKFWFYSPSANDGDGSILKVYTGVYQGNDRSGFNLNIKKAPAALTVTSFSFVGAVFSEVTLETNLAYDQWHFVEVTTQYAADGDPDNDVFTYQFNGSTIHNEIGRAHV